MEQSRDVVRLLPPINFSREPLIGTGALSFAGGDEELAIVDSQSCGIPLRWNEAARLGVRLRIVEDGHRIRAGVGDEQMLPIRCKRKTNREITAVFLIGELGAEIGDFVV